MKNILSLILFCWLLSNTLIGQTFETIPPPNTTTSSTYNFKVHDLPNLTSYPGTFCKDAEGVTIKCPNDPSYGFFWIFGDGHFDYFSGNPLDTLLPKKASTSPQITHTYDNTISSPLELSIYYTKRYTNSPPPPPMTLLDYYKNGGSAGIDTMTTTNPLPPPPLGTSFQNVIQTKPTQKGDYPIYETSTERNKIAIIANQYPVPAYPVVLSLSFLPPVRFGGSVLLFYNGEKTNTGTVAKNDVFQNLNTHLPFYYSKSRVLSPSPISYFNNMVSLEFSPKEIAAAQKGKGQEMRLFHVLEVNPKAVVGNDFEFLAVLVSDSLDYNNDTTPIFQNNKIQDLAVALSAQNKTVYDYVELEVPIKSANDPNKLCITDIHECEDESNTFKVSFSLMICNDGEGLTDYVNVKLTEQGADYSRLNFENMVAPNNTERPFIQSETLELIAGGGINFSLPGIPEGFEGSHCFNLEFNIRSEKKHLNRLLTKGAIKAEVQLVAGGIIDEALSEAYYDCNPDSLLEDGQQAYFDTNSFQKCNCDYDCKKKPCTSWCCNFLLVLTQYIFVIIPIIIGLLILLYLLFFRKKS